MKTLFLQAYKVRPGQKFFHLGQEYVRALPQEERRHPAAQHERYTADDLVMAYTTEQQRTPVAFLSEEFVVVFKGGF